MASYLFFILPQAQGDLKRNTLRTLLTALGILIGISSVVLLTALTLGLKRYIEAQFQSLGTNLIMVLPGKALESGFRLGTSMMRGGVFDEKDLLNISKLKNVSLSVPAFVKFSAIAGNGKSEVYELIASTGDIFPLLDLTVETGELFDRADVEKRSKVIVLGTNPAQKIFGTPQNAVGKIAKLESLNFRVIGVLKAKGGGGLGEPGMDDHVFIPHTAALSFNPSKKFFTLYARAVDTTRLTQTKDEITQVLLKRYDDSDFSVVDEKEVLDMLSSIFAVINIILVGVSTISLLVGGVGVMNIMYVSVVERIGEIGIRRAVGATRADILWLFLAEAVGLSLLGGLLGLGLSFAIVWAVQSVFPAYISIFSVVMALLVSSAIGIVFGVLPARRAANLTPIEAIRTAVA